MYNYWREQQRKSHFQLTQLNMTNSNQPLIGRLTRNKQAYHVKALKAICTDSIPVMYLVEWVQEYIDLDHNLNIHIKGDTWQDCPELSPSQVNQLLTPDCRSMTMAEVQVMQDKKRTIRNMIFTFIQEVWKVLRPGRRDDDEGATGRFPHWTYCNETQLTNINRLYMDLFYYNTQIDNLMTTKYRREIEMIINQIKDGGDVLLDDVTELYPFLNPDVYSAEKAIKIAKNEQMNRRLRTNAVVSVFMEHCRQGVPELLRTTMEFVGNTGYTHEDVRHKLIIWEAPGHGFGG